MFGKNSHNQDDMLVKLIRSRILGSSSWGVYNKIDTITGKLHTYAATKNDWTGNGTGVKANLNVLLNNYFYKKTNVDATYGNCEEWTYYTYIPDAKTNDCGDLVGYGIDSDFQEYITEARWHLYGYNSLEFSKQNFYQCERGLSSDTTNCLVGGTTDASYSAYADAKIGLIYASNYLYASGYFSSEDETLANDSSNRHKYSKQNWLYKGYEWCITPKGGVNNTTFYVSSNGYLSGTSVANSGYGYRPSFYLKSSVYYTGGSGTFDDPYTIACDDCAE